MENTAMQNYFDGPLKVHPQNPRYFTDRRGKAIYLTGAHTWENLQDFILPGKPSFDYQEYLDFMEKYHHNFMRMWIWEHSAWMAGSEEKYQLDPLPYLRTGPGTALDGFPKYDLSQWNESFFQRLRQRVIQAGARGIYVSIMLFQGWSVKKPWLPGDPWKGHPYHRDNNINSIDGDNNSDGVADIHCMDIPSIVSLQEALIRKIIDTVNDLDNVLYEIINEAPGEDRTVFWQAYLASYIHQYESQKPNQHPVGITPSGNWLEKYMLFTGPADWVSPTYLMDHAYFENPPAADGSKVILNDTDHVENQLKVTYQWVWRCFLRGHHPVFMDPWKDETFCGAATQTPEFRNRLEFIYKNMGYSLEIANHVNLAEMLPHNDISATGYCLAHPGEEYLVYFPQGGCAGVDLSDTAGRFSVTWFDPVRGKTLSAADVSGGFQTAFTAPFENDAVLHLRKVK